MSKQIECPYCKYSISKPEEKRTDVNISVRMMADCVQDKTDVIVLISADTDLIPPLNFIHTNYPNKKVKVFFPPGSHALELHNHLRTFHSKWIFSKRMNVDFVMLSCPILSQLEISLFLYLRNGNS
ncbi:NYN domain-containing protein [Prevotella melaninogenica]|nr:NYN domain-containing protein [Prevotella melaninogenica]